MPMLTVRNRDVSVVRILWYTKKKRVVGTLLNGSCCYLGGVCARCMTRIIRPLPTNPTIPSPLLSPHIYIYLAIPIKTLTHLDPQTLSSPFPFPALSLQYNII